MTSNQQRAVALARDVCVGAVDASSLSDAAWQLLLLAAGTNNCRSLPLPVCRRVLERAETRTGYFSAAKAGLHGPAAAVALAWGLA